MDSLVAYESLINDTNLVMLLRTRDENERVQGPALGPTHYHPYVDLNAAHNENSCKPKDICRKEIDVDLHQSNHGIEHEKMGADIVTSSRDPS